MHAKGINPVAPTSVADRLRNQELLLDLFLENLSAAPRPALTDRSPLDMAAYMLAEVGMHSDCAEVDEGITKYVARCLYETNKRFDAIFVVNPLPVYEVDPTKPPPSKAYQWHHRILVGGLAGQLENTAVYKLADLGRDVRCESVGRVLTARLAAWKEFQTKVSFH
jgi:hypothetical protein